MKILLITSSFLPRVGGLENAVYHLAGEIKTKHSVRIITNRYPRQLPKKEVIDNMEVHRLFFLSPLFRGKTTIQFLKYLAGLFLIPATIFSLFRKVNSFKPDVINYHFIGDSSLYVLFVVKILKSRLIVSVHGEDIESFPHESRYNMWLVKQILKNADYVTACSDYILSRAKKIVPEIRNKSMATGNGIILKDYEDKTVYNFPKPYIFSMGRFVKKKGFDLLILAFEKVLDSGEDIHLFIAGDGPEKDSLQALINHLKLGDRINLIGFVKGAEKIKFLNGCQFFVLPSRREPFGIVILEAMASQKPIVASRVGGVPEIIQGGQNGFLIEPDDPELLSEGIIHLLTRDDLKRKIAAEGFETVRKKFTWEKVSGQYLTLYDKIIP